MLDGVLDGTIHPTLPGPAARDLARRRRTLAAAATVAAGLHVAVLAPLLWFRAAPPRPDAVATVELTPMPVAAPAPPAPDQPVTESTAGPATPDAVRPVEPPAAVAAPPPEVATQPSPPDATTAPAPEPVASLASSEPPVETQAPAELLHAAQPPPDAIEAASPPVPVAALPRPPPVPPLPRPPPRPAARPAPRREAVAAVAPASPAPVASPAPAATPAPPPAPPSNAVPTWRGDLIGRLQRAKRYPDSARSRNEQGVATVSFTLDRAGHVVSATIVTSSGSLALDEETIALVRRAEPLPAPPAEIPGATVTLTVPVTFTLR